MPESAPGINPESFGPTVVKSKIKDNKMKIANTLSALSLAFAMFGGAAMIAPSSAHAGQFISNGALAHGGVSCSVRGGQDQNCRPGKQANPPSKFRPCLKSQRCRG
jgi:hypothetical protein